ncbi:hypothetical protein A3E49_00700 [Candidatus Saccharibacteria bacterium RIFCSPHIGHO2_12_FULL_49_19]|nr:MAG: hypothetical protein A3E49_00700 [Candidatus Saccharibacteria bacterium RIFCSPHIGHO2_12_FULL_49_19]OGL37683.1 MAG: hypothetical protein A3B63_03720 [Candidatus Saccharibacteria bacterium RIFCSPLOWO2_01_FULL_49_22]
MLKTTHNLIKDVGKKLGLTSEQIEKLLAVDKIHEFEIQMESGKKHQAYRVQHSNKLGPYKGGIRFHPDVSLEEVQALAILMSLKAAAIGLPLGGAKGGVAVNPKEMSLAELEELSRDYVLNLHEHIGPDKDVPAPDVNTDSQIIDWMVDEYEKLTGDTSKASFTGKSVKAGGSLGRDEATGRGGVIVLRQILNKLAPSQSLGEAVSNRIVKRQAFATGLSISEPITYAVQGFGNVGAHFALVAAQEQPDWMLVAATDSSGGVYSPADLSVKQLAQYKSDGGRLHELNEGRAISNKELIGLDVDVLVLAALGGAVTEKNMHQVKAHAILELANGPVSDEAAKHLESKGIMIIPDILANSGGVIVSYLEWLQNKQGEHWTEAEVNKQLEEYLVKATNRIYDMAQKRSMTLKEAALAVAIERLVKS